MELRHLRYLSAVAEAENFREAAHKLHVSQSPLSRQVQQLADEVGVPLFARAGRGVRLTAAGRAFSERARSILAAVDAAVEEARETAQGRVGTITIGFESGTAYFGNLSVIVSKLRRREPRIGVQLVRMSSAEQWEALRLGKITLGFGHYVPGDGSLDSVGLARHRLGVVIPRRHRLSRKREVRVRDLANEPVLMLPRHLHPRLHDDIIAGVRAHRVVLDLAAEVQDGEALWTLVSAGGALAFAAENEARFLLMGPALWRPVTDLRVEVRDMAMWRPGDASSPLLRPLLSIVREDVVDAQRPRSVLGRAKAAGGESRRGKSR